ncbi:MAG: hypothetical protein ACK4IY_03615 [Chitinophagales bacterium]
MQKAPQWELFLSAPYSFAALYLSFQNKLPVTKLDLLQEKYSINK